MNAHDQNWLAIDWGTSKLRVWLMSPDNQVSGYLSSDKGMGVLDTNEFEPALLELVKPWLVDRPTQAIACGMVGAKQGWTEVPYAEIPTPLHTVPGIQQVPVQNSRIRLGIIPGICQAQPADVMRGEETQLAGFLSTNPTFSGIVCLPGTHTKWAVIEQGVLNSFTTYMTGELYAVLSTHSLLRHSLSPASNNIQQAENTHELTEKQKAARNVSISNAFVAHFRKAFDAPQQFSSSLFNFRAESLLHGMPPENIRAALSGLLLGQELSAVESLLTESPVIIIGAEEITDRYGLALSTLSFQYETHDSDLMSLNGLISAHSKYTNAHES